MKAESGLFHCLSADKADPMCRKVPPKCGKGLETCGGYWNPVEGHWKGMESTGDYRRCVECAEKGENIPKM